MSETVNQETATKTFTQEEVNAIVADRLDRERKKYEGFDELKEKATKFDEMAEAQKSELQKATERADALAKELDGMKKAESVRTIREQVAKETGVPASLLTFETEEDCKTQAQQILNFSKPAGYPSVKDGGEVQHAPASAKPEEAFKEWFEANFH